MSQKSRLTQFIFATMVVVCLNGSLQAAWGTKQAPAGQVCPLGSYVTGFDSEANIICSEACGNGVLNPGESCDDGNNQSGDGCPATCQAEGVEPGAANEGIAEQAEPMDTDISPTLTTPVISDVRPSKLTFGTRELVINVIGAGFHADTVIIFLGSIYETSVNQAGTQLKATIPTRELSMGPYSITVSNGPGIETTLKRALEIY